MKPSPAPNVLLSRPPSPSLDGPLAPERRPGFWFDARLAAFLLKVEQPPRVRTQAPLLLSASQTFLPPRWHGRRGDAGPELPQRKKKRRRFTQETSAVA